MKRGTADCVHVCKYISSVWNMKRNPHFSSQPSLRICKVKMCICFSAWMCSLFMCVSPPILNLTGSLCCCKLENLCSYCPHISLFSSRLTNNWKKNQTTSDTLLSLIFKNYLILCPPGFSLVLLPCDGYEVVVNTIEIWCAIKDISFKYIMSFIKYLMHIHTLFVWVSACMRYHILTNWERGRDDSEIRHNDCQGEKMVRKKKKGRKRGIDRETMSCFQISWDRGKRRLQFLRIYIRQVKGVILKMCWAIKCIYQCAASARWDG